MPATPVHVELKRLPSLPFSYLKALFHRKPETTRSPTVIVASLAGLRLDGARLDRYRRLFGLPVAGSLPILYPQVVIAAAFAKLILRPEFPFRPLGLVHRRTLITLHRALASHAAYDVELRIQVAHDTEQGTEVAFVTELCEAGERVWHGQATVLLRRRGEGNKRLQTLPPPPALDTPDTRVVTWHVGGNTGRRYAAVSGDYNPIHLSRLTARLFGYERAIAHGLWTLGRTLAELEPVPKEPLFLEAAFKRPLFLPSTVHSWARQEADGVHFGVRDGATGAPHLIARMHAL